MGDLEDIIRIIIELIQGGIQIITVPSQDLKGSKRSLIRKIGSMLPLAPVKRIRFETVCLNSKRRSTQWKPTFFDEDSEEALVLTLADICWLDVTLPEVDLRQRCEYWKPKKTKRKTMYVRPFITLQNESPRQRSMLPLLDESIESIGYSEDEYANPCAMKKISALEEELAKLRAQIAAIVQNPTPSVVSPTYIATSASPVLPSAPPPYGAPPPPPPPPPPVMEAKKQLSLREIILQNKAKNGSLSTTKSKHSANDQLPDMSEVLKGLGTVKLKKIARSPGGTPLRQAPKHCDSTDPAAIIARALKKKFAQVSQSSPDKENYPSRFTPSPKKTRSPLKFGPHLLKPARSRRLSNPQKRPLMEIN